MITRRGSVLGWACASFVAFGISPASAQQGDFAVLRVRVFDASTKAPIAGAQVGFPDLDLFVLTDSTGLAEITGVLPGDRTLEATMLGFGTASTTISLDARAVATGDIALEEEPIRIEGITVTTPPPLRRGPNLILQDELDAPGIRTRTVLEAIQRLRPNWIRRSRPPANTFQGGGVFPGGGATRDNGSAPSTADQFANELALNQSLVGVVLNDVPVRYDMLRNLQALEVTSVEYLRPSEATTRFGTGYPNGALRITTMKAALAPQR